MKYNNEMLVRRSDWLKGMIETEFWIDIEEDFIEKLKSEIINTEPDDVDGREFLFAKCRAALDFFAHLRGVVEEKALIEDSLN